MLYMVTFTINIPQNVSIYTIHGSYGYGLWMFMVDILTYLRTGL